MFKLGFSMVFRLTSQVQKCVSKQQEVFGSTVAVTSLGPLAHETPQGDRCQSQCIGGHGGHAGYVCFHNIVVARVDHGPEKTEKMTLKARLSD